MPKFIPTEEQKELLLKLHNEGKSVQAISKEISFTGSGPIKRILLEMGCTLFEKRPNLTEDETLTKTYSIMVFFDCSM